MRRKWMTRHSAVDVGTGEVGIAAIGEDSGNPKECLLCDIGRYPVYENANLIYIHVLLLPSLLSSCLSDSWELS
jgi:hypothetical protein